MNDTVQKPNPGTPEAIELGCSCPVIDNHYGKGVEMNGEIVYWYSDGCLLHV